MTKTKGIFISGTSTGVGKTYVTGLIVQKLRQNGINAGYYKPVLSGTEIINGKIIAGDAKYVCDKAGITREHTDFVSYYYKTAASPHLAAHLEQNLVEFDKIKSDFEKIRTSYEYLTTEGCGGLFCPIRTGEKEIFLTDIIKTLNLDVIIIAPSGLGAINTTFLTCEYAKRVGINIKGIIMNNYNKESIMHADNKIQIEYLTKIPVIATVEKNCRCLSAADIDMIKGIYRPL